MPNIDRQSRCTCILPTPTPTPYTPYVSPPLCEPEVIIGMYNLTMKFLEMGIIGASDFAENNCSGWTAALPKDEFEVIYEMPDYSKYRGYDVLRNMFVPFTSFGEELMEYNNVLEQHNQRTQNQIDAPNLGFFKNLCECQDVLDPALIIALLAKYNLYKCLNDYCDIRPIGERNNFPIDLNCSDSVSNICEISIGRPGGLEGQNYFFQYFENFNYIDRNGNFRSIPGNPDDGVPQDFFLPDPTNNPPDSFIWYLVNEEINNLVIPALYRFDVKDILDDNGVRVVVRDGRYVLTYAYIKKWPENTNPTN